MGTALNVALITASALETGFRVAEFASGERDLSASQVGITLLIAVAGPVAGRVASLLGRKVLATGSVIRLAPGAIRLSEAAIRGKLVGDPMRTQQASVSIRRIEEYIEDLLNGAHFPPIKVDKNVIVDGHHRYIASKITGIPIETTPGTRALFLQRQPTKPLSEIEIY